MAPRASYVLVLWQGKVRLAGNLARMGSLGKIAQQLPEDKPNHPGSAAAVDFELAPGASRIVRFLVTWHSPQWKGGGHPSSDKGDSFTHITRCDIAVPPRRRCCWRVSTLPCCGESWLGRSNLF